MLLLLLLLDTFVYKGLYEQTSGCFLFKCMRFHRGAMYGICEMAQKLKNSHITFQGLENHVC